MLLWRLLGFSAVHFGLWFLSFFIAYGTDFDHVPGRSGLATAAASVCKVLQYPHDLVLRALPDHLLQQVPQVALVLVTLNSLTWGVVLLLMWRRLSARSTRKGGAGSPHSRVS